jgi:putative lipoprotein
VRPLALVLLLALPLPMSAQRHAAERFPAAGVASVALAARVTGVGNGPASARVPEAMQAAERDPWFGPDKVKHFFVAAALQSLGYGALRAADVEHRNALAGASALTAAFGIVKELSDRRQGRRVSGRDLLWDAAGAAAISVLLARTER